MSSRRFTKADIEMHADHYHARPAVNIKVYSDWCKVPVGPGTEFDDPGFTHDWIEALSDDERESAWQFACESNFEVLEEDAKAIFGSHVKCYTEGRSGGWAVVHGIDDDVESWDAIAVGKWGRFATIARALADDVPYQFVSSLYINNFEWEREQREQEMRALAVSAMMVH